MSEEKNQSEQSDASGVIAWLQRQNRTVRILTFAALSLIGVGILFLITALLYFQNIRSVPRTVTAAIPDSGVTVREFVRFADDETEAYPSALAIAPDGTLYSASYITGEIWRIAPDATVEVIPDTQQQIGAPIGLDVDANGTLYVLDRIDWLELSGAIIWRIAGNTIEEVIRIPLQGRRFVSLPNDIAVDAAGNLYVVDVQYDPGFAAGRVLKVNVETGEIENWWQVDDANEENPFAPTGLAYDESTDSLIVAEVARQTLYRIPLGTDEPQAEILYTYTGDDVRERPGFNGVDVAPDGTIYTTALALNRLARLDDGDLTYLAAGFRGGSDLAYDATNNRIFVNNWDQRWLLPVRFVFISRTFEPRLPFSIDVVTFD